MNAHTKGKYMSKFINSGVVLLSVLVLSSCGVKKETSSSRSPYVITSFGIPEGLKYSNVSCSSALDASFFPASLFINGKNISKEYVTLKNTNTMFNEIKLGGEFESLSQDMYFFIWDTVSQAKDFTECKTSVPHEDKTYEKAALSLKTIVNGFENNHAKFLQAYNFDKLSLKVVPKLRYPVSESGYGYAINNAYYYTPKKEVVFLPQGIIKGITTQVPFGGTPLWEIPMVVLHEYGHHIFSEIIYKEKRNSLFSEYLASKNTNHIHNEFCFDSAVPGVKYDYKDVQAAEGQEGAQYVIKSINEGFADLISYYGSKDKSSLKGVGCMAFSRDVYSPYFISGIKKSLNEDAIRQFKYGNDKKLRNCIDGVNYVDPHMIGAIYAHAIYTIINDIELSDSRALFLLSTWLEEVVKNAGEFESVEEMFAFFMETFISHTDNHYDVSPQMCERISQDYFPGLLKSCDKLIK